VTACSDDARKAEVGLGIKDGFEKIQKAKDKHRQGHQRLGHPLGVRGPRVAEHLGR